MGECLVGFTRRRGERGGTFHGAGPKVRKGRGDLLWDVVVRLLCVGLYPPLGCGAPSGLGANRRLLIARRY